MRALQALGTLLGCASAVLAIGLNMVRVKAYRAAARTGGVPAAETTANKVLRVAATVAFIVVALSASAMFITSVVKNMGTF